MTFSIQPHFQQLGNQALENFDKDAMPRFGGNEGVPIEANISPEKLVHCVAAFRIQQHCRKLRIQAGFAETR